MAHHYGPNLCPESPTIEPDRSRQQVPEKLQRQEMSSTSPTELQPVLIPEREEDQQQEDHRSSPENYIFEEISLEKHELFKKWPNVQDINWKNHRILELFAHYICCCCFPSIKNTSNLHPNSVDGFNNQTGTFILWFTERLKQSKGDERKKTDLFTVIMNLERDNLSIATVEAGERLQSFLEEYQKKHSGEEKQYAFAIVFLKDGKTVISDLFYPRHSKKRAHSDSIITDTLHSEQILIENLDTFLKNNGTNVQDVFIYTYYSPCTKRKKQHIDPCMSQLRQKADRWHNEYGFKTTVAFTDFCRLSLKSKQNYFNYVTDIPSDGSAFYPYSEKCGSIPFKLYSQDFDKLKPGQIQNLKDVEARNRHKLYEDIRSVLDNLKGSAETSFGLKTDHLERGEKMIVQSLENFQDQDIRENILKTLRKKWVEMVNNSFLSVIRKKLTAGFEAAVVHLAVKDLQLGNNSPLQFYHILDRNQNMLN